ncbi:MAG: transposase family protein [Alphaproteobacteria bacterium]|nr:transposase family protein [Alphaproteobacteria bacterium]
MRTSEAILRNPGLSLKLPFDAQLLLCLIYYRTYASQVFLGLVFNISSPTVCRCNQRKT